MTDAGHEGKWTWVTGELLTYKNWYKGYPCDEPNNGLGGPVENYAELWNGTNLTRNHAYIWNDGNFPKGSAFICEWDDKFIGFTENDDTCENTFDDKKLLALGGNDEIISSGNGVTINGGTGNNTINNGLYEGHTDTVSITLPYDKGLNYYQVNKFVKSHLTDGGNDVTITTDKGNDSILNLSGSGVLISTSGGNNTIQNGIFEGHVETVNVTVDSVTLDTKIFVTDKAYKGGDDVTIEAGSSDDIIQSFARVC